MKQLFQLSGALVLFGSSMFAGVDFGFVCVDVNAGAGFGNTGNCNVTQSNFNVNVDQSGSAATFTFTNSVAIASNVTEIYFDYPAGLFATPTGLAVVGQNGATFAVANNLAPGDLPGGNTISFVADEGVDSDQGRGSDGLDTATDWVTISLNLAVGKSLQDVYDALNDSSFRIGLHVRSIEGTVEGSDAFVTTPNPPERVIPEPSTYAVLAGSIGALVYARRRRQANKA